MEVEGGMGLEIAGTTQIAQVQVCRLSSLYLSLSPST